MSPLKDACEIRNFNIVSYNKLDEQRQGERNQSVKSEKDGLVSERRKIQEETGRQGRQYPQPPFALFQQIQQDDSQQQKIKIDSKQLEMSQKAHLQERQEIKNNH